MRKAKKYVKPKKMEKCRLWTFADNATIIPDEKLHREVPVMWLIAAFDSALFAGLTSILAKCGIKRTDSNVATAVRTSVVLIFAWLMVL